MPLIQVTAQQGALRSALLDELADGSWSGGGQIVRLDDIKAAMNIVAV